MYHMTIDFEREFEKASGKQVKPQDCEDRAIMEDVTLSAIWLESCYQAYERTGFAAEYRDYWDDEMGTAYHGRHFEVLRRVTEAEADWISLPMWRIRFSDGQVLEAGPMEICAVAR